MIAETIFDIRDLKKQMAEDRPFLVKRYGEREVKRVYKLIGKLKNMTPRGYQAKHIYVMGDEDGTLMAYAR